MTTKLQEYYLAFSVHNTDCFITANKKIEPVPNVGEPLAIDGLLFRIGNPRSTPMRSAIKLLANDLDAKSPPATVLAFFQGLEAKGWKVDAARFIAKHGLKAASAPEPDKPDKQVSLPTETPPAVPTPASVDPVVAGTSATAMPAAAPAQPLVVTTAHSEGSLSMVQSKASPGTTSQLSNKAWTENQAILLNTLVDMITGGAALPMQRTALLDNAAHVSGKKKSLLTSAFTGLVTKDFIKYAKKTDAIISYVPALPAKKTASKKK